MAFDAFEELFVTASERFTYRVSAMCECVVNFVCVDDGDVDIDVIDVDDENEDENEM